MICPSRHRSAIHHHIHSDTSSTLRIDLQTYDESQQRNLGTCDLLRQFSSRIPEDFVIVPCDFIPSPSVPLSALLNKFRVDVLADDSLATTFWFASSPPEKGTSSDDWGPPTVKFPIIWEPTTGTLLQVDTPDDVERNSEEIELRMTMLTRYVLVSKRTDMDLIRYLDIHTPNYRLLSMTRMFTSAGGQYWICCSRNHTSPLCGKSSSLGYARSSIPVRKERSTLTVCLLFIHLLLRLIKLRKL